MIDPNNPVRLPNGKEATSYDLEEGALYEIDLRTGFIVKKRGYVAASKPLPVYNQSWPVGFVVCGC